MEYLRDLIKNEDDVSEVICNDSKLREKSKVRRSNIICYFFKTYYGTFRVKKEGKIIKYT